MKILDLFCGAGGASMGYAMAGHEVTGVDIKKQRHYPFKFIKADALTFPIEDYDLIHASPPCQAHSKTRFLRGTVHNTGHMLYDTIECLQQSGKLFIVENVKRETIHGIEPIMLCGSMFGLQVRRHRYFWTNIPMLQMKCQHKQQGKVIYVAGHSGGTSTRDKLDGKGHQSDWNKAMNIDWMSTRELAQAIPPAYTEWLIGNI